MKDKYHCFIQMTMQIEPFRGGIAHRIRTKWDFKQRRISAAACTRSLSKDSLCKKARSPERSIIKCVQFKGKYDYIELLYN